LFSSSGLNSRFADLKRHKFVIGTNFQNNT
jgi:hypothetical protein